VGPARRRAQASDRDEEGWVGTAAAPSPGRSRCVGRVNGGDEGGWVGAAVAPSSGRSV